MTKKNVDVGRYLNLLLKLGISMVLSILTCFLGGFFLEKQFPSNGIILITFTFIGVAMGFVIMFREIKRLDQYDQTR